MKEAEAKAILEKDAQDIKEHKAVYVSTLPQCDMCAEDNEAEYDAKTYSGQWANMCHKHWLGNTKKFLGLGLGQRLIQRDPY